MNRFEQNKSSGAERHPAVKVIESILSEDNPKKDELLNIIQNAESYVDIKQYISKEKVIQGANGEKFHAQNLNPWIDMMRQQFPDIAQLRSTQMYHEIVSNVENEEAKEEAQSTGVVENADWLNDDVIANNTNDDMEQAQKETVEAFSSVHSAQKSKFDSYEDEVAEYNRRKSASSATDVLNKSRGGRNTGSSAESYLNK